MIDLDVAAVEAAIPIGGAPVGLVLDADAQRLYVANRGQGTLVVVDTAELRVRDTIAVSGAPGDVAVDPATGLCYVSNTASNTVSILRDHSPAAPAAPASPGPSPGGEHPPYRPVGPGHRSDQRVGARRRRW